MKTILTPGAPQPIGPYSQAIEDGGTLFCSGQIAINPADGQLHGDTAAEQAEQVCKNLKHVLEGAGFALSDVVKTTCFLVNPADFTPFNNVYARYFTTAPARSCVFVSALPKGALVEVELIAKK